MQVVVPTPDFCGRKEILNLYLAKVLHEDIDIDMLARGTTGFTGADLENMINQAALRYVGLNVRNSYIFIWLITRPLKNLLL